MRIAELEKLSQSSAKLNPQPNNSVEVLKLRQTVQELSDKNQTLQNQLAENTLVLKKQADSAKKWEQNEMQLNNEIKFQ